MVMALASLDKIAKFDYVNENRPSVMLKFPILVESVWTRHLMHPRHPPAGVVVGRTYAAVVTAPSRQ